MTNIIVVMAEKSTNPTVVTLDPMFDIPEGVSEFVYDSEEHNREPSVDQVEYLEDASLGDEYLDEDDTNYFDGPSTPDILGVVSQTLRRTPEGFTVVDVVVEVEDMPGDLNFEFRKTIA